MDLVNISISNIPVNKHAEAVEIFTEAFINDDLFMFAFPEKEQRKRLTKIMYGFVVYDLVPKLNLTIKGAYINNVLAGCIIYTTPDANEWGEQMYEPLQRMREKAGDDRIKLIGEFAMLHGYEPEGKYYYGNELAVRKDFRNKGIGKALVKYMIDESGKSKEANGILIDTANLNNVKMYRRWGFELMEIKDFYELKKYFLWREKE